MSIAPFLEEHGLVISLDSLSRTASCIAGAMGIVRIMRKGNVLTKLVAPTFHLVVSTKANPGPETVFETKDADLKNSIEEGINRVAAALGGRREL